MITVYRFRVLLANILDWIDDRILKHRYYSVCCFIVLKVYPMDWCSEHGRFEGSFCPECRAEFKEEELDNG